MRCKNAFSTRCRSLYRSRSYSYRTLRFFLRDHYLHASRLSPIDDGIRVVASIRVQDFGIYPSINRSACAQSAEVSFVTKTRIGIPCVSTARCILVLSPLLYGSSSDYRHRYCRMGMNLDMTGVDHQSFKVRFVHQQFKHPLPCALVPPTLESLIYRSPFAVFWRQISPRRTCP